MITKGQISSILELRSTTETKSRLFIEIALKCQCRCIKCKSGSASELITVLLLQMKICKHFLRMWPVH